MQEIDNYVPLNFQSLVKMALFKNHYFCQIQLILQIIFRSFVSWKFVITKKQNKEGNFIRAYEFLLCYTATNTVQIVGSDDKIKTKNSLVSIKLFIFPSQGFSVHPLANKDASYYIGSLAVCYSINN